MGEDAKRNSPVRERQRGSRKWAGGSEQPRGDHFHGFYWAEGRVTCFKIPPLSNGKRDQETEWKKKMGERQQATWEWHLGYPNSFSLPRSKKDLLPWCQDMWGWRHLAWRLETPRVSEKEGPWAITSQPPDLTDAETQAQRRGSELLYLESPPLP